MPTLSSSEEAADALALKKSWTDVVSYGTIGLEPGLVQRIENDADELFTPFEEAGADMLDAVTSFLHSFHGLFWMLVIIAVVLILGVCFNQCAKCRKISAIKAHLAVQKKEMELSSNCMDTKV